MEEKLQPVKYTEIISQPVIVFLLGLILTPILAFSGAIFSQGSTTPIFMPLMIFMLIDAAILLPITIYGRVTSYLKMTDDLKIQVMRYHAKWTIYYCILIFLIPIALLYGLPLTGRQYTIYTVFWLILFLDGLVAMYLFMRMRLMGIEKKYAISYVMQILLTAWYFNWLLPMVYFSIFAIR